MSTDNPDLAGQKATLEDALPARGLRLLGTMGTAQAPEALLLYRGQILRVEPGQNAAGMRVLAIEPGRVTFDHRGEARALGLPGAG